MSSSSDIISETKPESCPMSELVKSMSKNFPKRDYSIIHSGLDADVLYQSIKNVESRKENYYEYIKKIALETGMSYPNILYWFTWRKRIDHEWEKFVQVKNTEPSRRTNADRGDRS